MKKADFLSRLILSAGFACAGLPGMSITAYAIPQLDTLGTEQVSVRELMRLDTEQALKLAREQSGVMAASADGILRVSHAMSGEPRLTAIYGVGKRLMAEVTMGDNRYLYRRGQALPVGVAPGADVYILHKISSSCIELEHSGDVHQLCLPTSQWVAQ